MKKGGFVWLLLYTLLLLSCASGKSASFSSSDTITDSHVEISVVQVSIDHVPEKDIAEQIRLLAGNYLISSAQNTGNGKIMLDIQVNQRSYLNGTSLYNALFLSFRFSSETGETASIITVYNTGRETIVSAATQQKYVLRAMRTYFKNRSRNERK
jgi:hypothetical protein